MLGKNIVVFEKIYALNADGTPNYNKLLVEHTDMNDDLQTVKFQKISTELTVSDTGLTKSIPLLRMLLYRIRLHTKTLAKTWWILDTTSKQQRNW